MIAHQYKIRQREAETDIGDLFGQWWKQTDLSLENTDVVPVTPATAASIILRYEWLGTMPPFIVQCFGQYFMGPQGPVLGGAIVLSQRMEQNLVNSGQLQSVVPNDALYLSRGACAHWTPKNAASNLISRAARQMGECSILAYADPDAGETGQIYRALNWHYLGPTRDHADPSGFYIDGKFHSTRDLKLYSLQRVREKYPRSHVSASSRKHRYVGVYGSRRYKRRIAKELAPELLPYSAIPIQKEES